MNNQSCCVFNYADDVLLGSTTASGLQKQIDVAVEYVKRNGMRFNPKCLIKGECPFDEIPKWTIENQVLSVEPEVNHLGVKISNKSNKSLESEALCLNNNDENNQYSEGVMD